MSEVTTNCLTSVSEQALERYAMMGIVHTEPGFRLYAAWNWECNSLKGDYFFIGMSNKRINYVMCADREEILDPSDLNLQWPTIIEPVRSPSNTLAWTLGVKVETDAWRTDRNLRSEPAHDEMNKLLAWMRNHKPVSDGTVRRWDTSDRARGVPLSNEDGTRAIGYYRKLTFTFHHQDTATRFKSYASTVVSTV